MGWKTKECLDFPHTCPVIDDGLAVIAEAVEQAIPESEHYDDSALCDAIMAAITPLIEAVRKTNVDMRKAADDRIEELCGDVDSLKDRLHELGRDCERLQSRLSEYES